MEALSYCQLMERCLAAEARVAELESRTVTVKLPNRWDTKYNTIGGRFNEKRYDQDVINTLRTAGIQVSKKE